MAGVRFSSHILGMHACAHVPLTCHGITPHHYRYVYLPCSYSTQAPTHAALRRAASKDLAGVPRRKCAASAAEAAPPPRNPWYGSEAARWLWGCEPRRAELHLEVDGVSGGAGRAYGSPHTGRCPQAT